MNDIKKYGATDGTAHYWIRCQDGTGHGTTQAYLSLVAIDELGKLTHTGTRAQDDRAAMSRNEAIISHLAGAIAVADVDLERRRAKMPKEPDTEPEPPPDPATRAFFDDSDD